jgi:hypothetical protein
VIGNCLSIRRAGDLFLGAPQGSGQGGGSVSARVRARWTGPRRRCSYHASAAAARTRRPGRCEGLLPVGVPSPACPGARESPAGGEPLPGRRDARRLMTVVVSWHGPCCSGAFLGSCVSRRGSRGGVSFAAVIGETSGAPRLRVQREEAAVRGDRAPAFPVADGVPGRREAGVRAHTV